MQGQTNVSALMRKNIHKTWRTHRFAPTEKNELMKHKANRMNESATTVSTMTVSISTVGAGLKPAPTTKRTDLPDGWDVLHLEDVVDILDSQRVPVNATDRESRQGKVPYYGATGQVGWIDDYLFDEELVLLGEDGAPFLEPTKQKAYIIRGKSWVNNHAHVLRAHNGIPNAYIKYYLDIVDYHKFVSGTTRLKLNQSAMRQIPVPIAPSDQQKRIVAEIEKQFSRLDEAVAALKRIQANLKRYKASVLKAAVEGKLTEEWRSRRGVLQYAPTKDKTGADLLKRILIERRKKWEEDYVNKYVAAHGHAPKDDLWKKKYKEPAGSNGTDLPQLPEGWTAATIEQLLFSNKDALKTGPFGSLLKKHEHQTSGVAVLGIENIQAMHFIRGSKIHITEKKAHQLEGYRALPGDILISRSGTVGEVCVVPEDIGDVRISTNLIKVSLAKNGMLPEWFIFLFNGSPFVLRQVKELCKGSSRLFLNQDILRHLIFVLPPLEEQNLIIREVHLQFTVITTIENGIESNLKRAEHLRQSILQCAFRGNLTKDKTKHEREDAL